MAKQKKKLSPVQKAAKKKRQKEYMTIFINGKQKRVKRPVTIDGMDVDEFIRRNADPIWLHQNEMWEYMGLAEDDDPFLFHEFDEKGKKQGLTLAWMANMKMHVGYVSASEAGDYYQVLFEERDPDSEQDSLGGKYLLIQRQFELPNGSRIYVESHDQDFIGHFKVVKARLNPKCLSLTLSRKTSATIEVTFETSPENYAEVKRVLSVMIPNIELQNEG
jgi:hypothetical protein